MVIDIQIENDFPEAYNKLCKLFGFKKISSYQNRINEIYKVTEEKWEENIERLLNENIRIKYLLLGEAAPLSDEGKVKYFYNNCHEGWGNRILPVFFNWEERNRNHEWIMNELAKRKFILIDTLPFAMNYSLKGLRGRPGYKELVKLCIDNYFMRKLLDKRLLWEDQVKVAFGLKLNAEALQMVYSEGLPLPNGQKIVIDKELFAINPSNYLDSDKLRQVFDLV